MTGEIERLRASASTTSKMIPVCWSWHPVSSLPCFQLVPESKVVKNRMHLDLRCDDLEAETERLVDLGARVLATTGPRPGWVVLADPEGNEFCLAGPHPL
jgi:hypothetical protein